MTTKAKMIQLGQTDDPPITGALDLRGKTTLREAAAVLANAQLFVGQAGFLMHLARAVETRSVIVFAGREDPAVFGYSANENLVGRTHCSPCWQRTRCDYGRECMRMITVDDICTVAERQMQKRDAPLPLETPEI